MICANFLLENVFFGGKLQLDVKNLNFEIFESALYLKSVSMPLTKNQFGRKQNIAMQEIITKYNWNFFRPTASTL